MNVFKIYIYTLPFTVFLEHDDIDPDKTLIERTYNISYFETFHQDKQYYSISSYHCNEFINALWAKRKDNINNLDILADGDDKELQTWAKK